MNDGETCSGIDECCEGTHDCDDNATCTNTVSSFTCACDPGFEGNGTDCDDTDECNLEYASCHVPSPSSFSSSRLKP
ncbi:hypothetical protein T484DRAFT_1833638 [Baffinella frigidus]|nr:hypothetical protein T484DRAFT_1833638 [Cryptophyta sp. CCMP2293]